jgi:copper transport protein
MTAPTWLRRTLVPVALLAGLLAVPASASAHAALLSTTPRLGSTVETPPDHVGLVYSEPVEPRFAIVSVTNANGEQVTTGPPTRSATNANELDTPLRKLPEGWYLVFWRVISEDGHPVRGAFTFAVGPSPGPPPQFPTPSLNETAATPMLIAARWASLIGVMLSVGLLVFRLLIARFAVRRVPGLPLRAVDLALACTLLVAAFAIPIYLDLTTAEFALRSSLDVSNIVPLVRASSFGRAFSDLWLLVGLLGAGAAIALWVDRPERESRSVAELLATLSALLLAAMTLVVPGLAGHPATTSPAGLALSLDWVHLLTGSVWLGGLVGLLVLAVGARERRVPALAWVVPRFSNVALVSVLGLVLSGTVAAILHLPTVGSLWQTSYGQAILVKIVLLIAALGLGGVNFARSAPRLQAARERPDGPEGSEAAHRLRWLVGGEALLVAGAVAAAATLTSLPPPSQALGKAGQAVAHLGPGVIGKTLQHGAYTLKVGVQPNKAAVPNDFSVELLRGGKPVRGAQVTLRFDMLDMDMSEQSYLLREAAPGFYRASQPALVMAGHWGLTYEVQPKGATAPFDVIVTDHAEG